MTTLISKLAKASIEVGSLAADKKNKDQNYDYISADQILQKAGDALANNGVCVIPSIDSTELTFTERQGKAPRIDAEIVFTMTVTDGEKDIVSRWTGWGSDYSTPDKAVYKAITSGHKYFLMKLLSIGIGNEDGEHEVEAPAKTEPTEAERKAKGMATFAELKKRADKVKVDIEPMSASLSADEMIAHYKTQLQFVKAAEAQAEVK